MSALTVLAICIAVVAGVSSDPQRIMGGSLTTITQYPSMVSVLRLNNNAFWQECAGTIINTRSILSAAHCTINYYASGMRLRVGSTYGNSGGVVHATQSYVNHPSFNSWTFDNDICILRTASVITYVNNNVQPGYLAGANYNLADNAVVWASGWGAISFGGPPSEQLRHVQIWIVNQAICAYNYAGVGYTITANMVCSGYYNYGGRDQCSQDSGGPLYHNGIVVGVCSFGYQCGNGMYPGVNTRVSRYSSWIAANA